MRYFTKELWARINDANNASRIRAEQEWNANCILYQQQFANVRPYLTHEFVNSFLTRKGLHDYTILGMTVIKEGSKYLCEIQLTNGSERVFVTMLGLRALQINVASFQSCMLGNLTWGYCEFDITSKGGIQLSVLCDMQNEMQFEFQKIILGQVDGLREPF